MASRTWSIVRDRTSWATVAFWIVVRVDRKTTITIVRIAIATTSSTKVKPRSAPSRRRSRAIVVAIGITRSPAAVPYTPRVRIVPNWSAISRSTVVTPSTVTT